MRCGSVRLSPSMMGAAVLVAVAILVAIAGPEVSWAGDTQTKADVLSLGVGFKTASIVLPYPFVELGVQSERAALRVFAGSIITWGKAGAEIALRKFPNEDTELFFGVGYEYVFMAYVARGYSIGVDEFNLLDRFHPDFIGKKGFVRVELGFYDYTMLHLRPEESERRRYRLFPSFGVGFRF